MPSLHRRRPASLIGLAAIGAASRAVADQDDLDRTAEDSRIDGRERPAGALLRCDLIGRDRAASRRFTGDVEPSER